MSNPIDRAEAQREAVDSMIRMLRRTAYELARLGHGDEAVLETISAIENGRRFRASLPPGRTPVLRIVPSASGDA